MENDLKGNENYFELTGGSSCRGFELPGIDYIMLISYNPDLSALFRIKKIFTNYTN